MIEIRANADRSINQLLCLILGSQKSRATGHLDYKDLQAYRVCFKPCQQEMEQVVRN